MRRLRLIHLYLGCLFAPALLFFAISGSWQIYRLQDSTKDSSYRAPAALGVLSAIHTKQHLPEGKASKRTPLHAFALLSAIGLVVTTVLGVVMAFRFSAGVVAPLLCLFGGIALPVLLLLIYH
ncbi:MAG: hypothetical protein ABI946_02535 [Chthoniobacterales bacterium]